jgi:hypothetical protein
MSPRNPITIAADLTTSAEQANTLLLPPGVGDAMNLAAEHATAVSGILLQAGLIKDPNAAPSGATVVQLTTT